MSKRILIVDDESSIREALSKVLSEEDYEVVSAENGREAIEKFKLERMDLALLDIGLPAKDGWQTLVWLTQVNPYLPVIVITGRSNQRELAERMGADAIMEKPLDVPRLLEIIRELTNEPMECRTRRDSSFRDAPCDHELFLKSLNERYTSPFKCPDSITTDTQTP
jgi:two-component system nitrogen regulation response regulator NtrX